MPCSQPLAKTKVRATINSVLLADCSLKFFPRTFGGGAFNWGQKGDSQTPDMYWYMEPAEVTRRRGRTLTASPTLASGSPLALPSVAKFAIYTASVHLRQAWIFFISQFFCESGIQGWLKGVFLVQGLSWGQDVRLGCSHLKVWLGLEDPFHPRWLTHRAGKSVLADGRGLSSLICGPLHTAAWVFSQHWWSAISTVSDRGDSKMEVTMSFMCWPWKSHTVIL